MPQRGPKRLEYIPPDYRDIRGIEHLTTKEQLTKLIKYINNENREPFDRLGCSTPQRPTVILRQALKQIIPLVGESAVPANVADGKDIEAVKSYLEKLSTSDGSKAAKLASRALTRAVLAEKSQSVQSSTWAVCVDGDFEVIIKTNIDPRSAYKWMKGSNRPWNLAATV